MKAFQNKYGESLRFRFFVVATLGCVRLRGPLSQQALLILLAAACAAAADGLGAAAPNARRSICMLVAAAIMQSICMHVEEPYLGNPLYADMFSDEYTLFPAGDETDAALLGAPTSNATVLMAGTCSAPAYFGNVSLDCLIPTIDSGAAATTAAFPREVAPLSVCGVTGALSAKNSSPRIFVLVFPAWRRRCERFHPSAESSHASLLPSFTFPPLPRPRVRADARSCRPPGVHFRAHRRHSAEAPRRRREQLPRRQRCARLQHQFRVDHRHALPAVHPAHLEGRRREVRARGVAPSLHATLSLRSPRKTQPGLSSRTGLKEC